MEAEKKMELKLYNTMTRHKEVFTPINPGKVGLYVCGTESHHISNLAHARAAVFYDVLHRYLKHLGYEVNFVRIFTDVGAKITRLGNVSGKSALELSDRLYKEYLVTMEALQCLPPTVDPRVSQHMNQIIDMIQKIIEKGCGYVVDGSVFFSVDKSPNYGKFLATRVKDSLDGKTMADFALWKAAKKGWDSPWGKGRPGGYIACSAISAHYLSPKFDIHGGPAELEFPHHENELAQTGATCEGGGANYWLHTKSAKSSTQAEKTIREMTESYHPLALRHFLMSAHYRSPLSFKTPKLKSSSEALYDIYQTLQDLSEALLPYREAVAAEGGQAQQTEVAKDVTNKLKNEFEAKMLDDLNTAHILTGAYQDALEFIKSSIPNLKEMQEEEERLSLLVSLVEIEKAAKEVLVVLGLHPALSYAEVLREMKEINEAREKAQLEREADELMRLKKMGACLHFIDTFRTTFYKGRPRTENTFTGGEMLVASGDKWREMTPEDKLRYEISAEKDFASIFEEFKEEPGLMS